MNATTATARATSTVAVLDLNGGDRIAAIIASEKSLRLVALSSDAAGFAREVASGDAGVAIIDVVGLSETDVVDVVRATAASATVIVVGDASDSAKLSRAVRSGARAFLLRPYDPDELIASIGDVQLATTRPRATDGATLLAVYAPKGGAGATTVATSLAVALAESGQRTALVDLDLRFGGVGVALDLSGDTTIAEVLAKGGALDARLVDDIFATHRSGLRVLLAPNDVGSAAAVSGADISDVLERLRPHFTTIVLDLPSGYDECTAAALAAADRVLLVTTPELAALRDVQRASQLAPALQNGKAQLIVNRWPSRAAIPPEEIERALGRKIVATIPSDGAALVRAANSGVPFDDRRAMSSKALRQLVRLIPAREPVV
ncbi:MAG: hypothetical protein AUH85_13730 [Chloroflexi bacterium 13_1_40CM_4_68_4]|nr:MAG: hypothetical protein AUH85_13730 [Chloroflexi bacterium 13_1_40CM_4_68_4]